MSDPDGQIPIWDAEWNYLKDMVNNMPIVTVIKGYSEGQKPRTIWNKVGKEWASGLISFGIEGGKGELVFENAPYHGKINTGIKNKAPSAGQTALKNSIPISPGTTTRRIGISNGEIVILDETTSGIFHGHVRKWSELTPRMRSVLQKAGLTNNKGKILK